MRRTIRRNSQSLRPAAAAPHRERAPSASSALRSGRCVNGRSHIETRRRARALRRCLSRRRRRSSRAPTASRGPSFSFAASARRAARPPLLLAATATACVAAAASRDSLPRSFLRLLLRRHRLHDEATRERWRWSSCWCPSFSCRGSAVALSFFPRSFKVERSFGGRRREEGRRGAAAAGGGSGVPRWRLGRERERGDRWSPRPRRLVLRALLVR